MSHCNGRTRVWQLASIHTTRHNPATFRSHRLTCAMNLLTCQQNWDCIVLFPSSQQAASTPRVVITGVGIITALGRGWESNAEGFRAGRLAIRPVSLFDVSRQRVKVAAE